MPEAFRKSSLKGDIRSWGEKDRASMGHGFSKAWRILPTPPAVARLQHAAATLHRRLIKDDYYRFARHEWLHARSASC